MRGRERKEVRRAMAPELPTRPQKCAPKARGRFGIRYTWRMLITSTNVRWFATEKARDQAFASMQRRAIYRDLEKIER